MKILCVFLFFSFLFLPNGTLIRKIVGVQLYYTKYYKLTGTLKNHIAKKTSSRRQLIPKYLRSIQIKFFDSIWGVRTSISR